MSLASKKRRRHARLAVQLAYHLPRLAAAAEDATRASEALAAAFLGMIRIGQDCRARLFPLAVRPAMSTALTVYRP